MRVFGLYLCKQKINNMSIREKQELKKQKQAFINENNAFVIRYEMIAKKSMTKTKLKKELTLSDAKFKELEGQYLKLFYGKQ